MLSAAASPFCRPIAPEGAFCKPEEDPFLLLESSLKAIERILLLLRRGLPLRRTWIEQPYGEEEITLLEEEVIPAIQQCLARVDELDERLLAQQEQLQKREAEKAEKAQQEQALLLQKEEEAEKAKKAKEEADMAQKAKEEEEEEKAQKAKEETKEAMSQMAQMLAQALGKLEQMAKQG